MAPPGHVHATCTEILQSTRDMAVYRAETNDGPRNIKVGFSEEEVEAMEREVIAYDELVRDLMGTEVSKIFGSYKGEDERGQPMTCLVGEKGDAIVGEYTSIPSLPMAER